MEKIKLEFENAAGDRLAGLLELSERTTNYYRTA